VAKIFSSMFLRSRKPASRKLLEAILLQAEVLDLKATPSARRWALSLKRVFDVTAAPS